VDHQHDAPANAFEQVFGVGCGYEPREFDPNLIAALDALGQTFGPLGVALAATTRTEPQALNSALGAAFAHQRELWSWLDCDRYWAEETADESGWCVVDGNGGGQIARIEHGTDRDAEDSAHALADHLNRKIILAKVAQATADLSGPRQQAGES
jgi:hypothetical protein